MAVRQYSDSALEMHSFVRVTANFPVVGTDLW